MGIKAPFSYFDGFACPGVFKVKPKGARHDFFFEVKPGDGHFAGVFRCG